MPLAPRAPWATPQLVPATRRRIGGLALLLGIYSLALGCWYRSEFVHQEVGEKAHVLSAYCFVEVFADAVFIFIVCANNDKITKGFLPKTLLVYIVCMGATLYSLTPILRLYDTYVPLCQGLRFAGNLIQLLLILGLVNQVWTGEPSSATPIPTVASSLEGALQPSVAAALDEGRDASSAAASSGCSSPRPCSPALVHRPAASTQRHDPEVILSVAQFMGHK